MPTRPPANGITLHTSKTSFDANLKNILEGRGVAIDPRDLVVDARDVQLHDLFLEVMKGGANAAVTQNDLWPVIGANLGFVQFPAGAGDPARSSSQIAGHLRYLYQKYLFPYEQICLNKLAQKKRRHAIQGQPPQNSLQLPQQHQQQTGQDCSDIIEGE